MSAKHLLRFAAVLGVLLLLWGAAALARRREVSASGEALRLRRMVPAQVDTVVLAKARDTTVLVRKGSTTWTVNGYPAAPKAVGDLFTALGDSVGSSELVAERKVSHRGLGVDGAGTRV